MLFFCEINIELPKLKKTDILGYNANSFSIFLVCEYLSNIRPGM